MILLTRWKRPRIPSRTALDGLETGSHRQIFTRPVASRKWCLFCSGHSEEISAEARSLKRIIFRMSEISIEVPLSHTASEKQDKFKETISSFKKNKSLSLKKFQIDTYLISSLWRSVFSPLSRAEFGRVKNSVLYLELLGRTCCLSSFESFLVFFYINLRLPWWLSDKEFACQCRRHRRYRFDPWAGKIHWRRKWQPTPVFLPGKFDGQWSLVGYSACSCKELDTTDGSMHASAIKMRRKNCHNASILYVFIIKFNIEITPNLRAIYCKYNSSLEYTCIRLYVCF